MCDIVDYPYVQVEYQFVHQLLLIIYIINCCWLYFICIQVKICDTHYVKERHVARKAWAIVKIFQTWPCDMLK